MNEEYVDMVCMYECEGSATAAVEDYQRFPNHRIPNTITINVVFCMLQEIGSLPSSNHIPYDRSLYMMIMSMKALLLLLCVVLVSAQDVFLTS